MNPGLSNHVGVPVKHSSSPVGPLQGRGTHCLARDWAHNSLSLFTGNGSHLLRRASALQLWITIRILLLKATEGQPDVTRGPKAGREILGWEDGKGSRSLEECLREGRDQEGHLCRSPVAKSHNVCWDGGGGAEGRGYNLVTRDALS